MRFPAKAPSPRDKEILKSESECRRQGVTRIDEMMLKLPGRTAG
jgi:hypothetical protein